MILRGKLPNLSLHGQSPRVWVTRDVQEGRAAKTLNMGQAHGERSLRRKLLQLPRPGPQNPRLGLPGSCLALQVAGVPLILWL